MTYVALKPIATSWLEPQLGQKDPKSQIHIQRSAENLTSEGLQRPCAQHNFATLWVDGQNEGLQIDNKGLGPGPAPTPMTRPYKG